MPFKIFNGYPSLRYGMSARADGSMKLFDTIQKNDSNIKNRQNYFKRVNIRPSQVVATVPAHGATVKVVHAADTKQKVRNVDGLITDAKNVYLTFTVADCFPTYFYDPVTHSIGLAHCGWRGVVAGIVDNAVNAFTATGALASNIRVGIGPGIQKCHFEIQDDVRDFFKDHEYAVETRDGKIFVDLPSILNRQLLQAGINPEHIEQSADCTYHKADYYFSSRFDKGEILRTMVAYIGKV